MTAIIVAILFLVFGVLIWIGNNHTVGGVCLIFAAIVILLLKVLP